VSTFLACGVAGAALDREERLLLEEVGPAGIVLFGRNVVEHGQLLDLVAELRRLPSTPYVAIDLEGGRVNRLEKLIGPLPSGARAAAAGSEVVRALGEAAGAACAHFGIGVDFAPVADVARQGGFLAAESRCLGASPAEARGGATAFLEGLASFGVAGCLKHYPGLGSGAVDSHRELPTLGESVRADAAVFHALAAPGRAVMVAHALAPSLGEGSLPATLSRTVVGPLREVAGPILADDLEMDALAAFGSLARRASAALAAGCDQVLLCNALAARRQVTEHVRNVAGRDRAFASALAQGSERLGGFGHGELRQVSWDEVMRLAERARQAAAEGDG
jgi:beta-N-acetylhexosaminidase